jgi:hypothetical protein
MKVDWRAVKYIVTGDESDLDSSAHVTTCMWSLECGGQTPCGRLTVVLSQCALTV